MPESGHNWVEMFICFASLCQTSYVMDPSRWRSGPGTDVAGIGSPWSCGCLGRSCYAGHRQKSSINAFWLTIGGLTIMGYYRFTGCGI